MAQIEQRRRRRATPGNFEQILSGLWPRRAFGPNG